MNPYLIGAGAALVLLVAAWIIWAEIRIRSLENSLIQSRQAEKDAEVVKADHILSDDELDALIRKDLSGSPPES